MFRPAGNFAYFTKEGHETIAATASMALTHWYMRKLPKLDDIPDPLPVLEVIPIARPFPGPYDQNFLPVVIGCIERTYGTAPEIAPVFLSREWYNNLPERLNDHKIVVQARRDADPKVVAYEEVCLSILKWLAKYGDVIDLEEP